jgi:hypothetical protein
VVAASRPVEDELARRVSTHLHRARAEDLAAELRLAVLPLIKEKGDWSAFRAFVP